MAQNVRKICKKSIVSSEPYKSKESQHVSSDSRSTCIRVKISKAECEKIEQIKLDWEQKHPGGAKTFHAYIVHLAEYFCIISEDRETYNENDRLCNRLKKYILALERLIYSIDSGTPYELVLILNSLKVVSEMRTRILHRQLREYESIRRAVAKEISSHIKCESKG